MVDDVEMLELVEEEIRDILAANGYDSEAPIIRGSALQAVENLTDAEKTQPIQNLLDALDTYIPVPPRDTEKDFLMPVEDVFSIKGRGTVVT